MEKYDFCIKYTKGDTYIFPLKPFIGIQKRGDEKNETLVLKFDHKMYYVDFPYLPEATANNLLSFRFHRKVTTFAKGVNFTFDCYHRLYNPYYYDCPWEWIITKVYVNVDLFYF